MTLDHDRAEIDLANAVRLLEIHLGRMETLAVSDLPRREKERLIRTANIYSSRTVSLMVQARKVEQMLPSRVI